MSFGKMSVHISIAEETVTKDAEGFATKTDNVLASIRAYREGRHGSQKWVNRASFSEATDLFRFRVIPRLNVTTSHVILCGDDRFEITSIRAYREGRHGSQKWVNRATFSEATDLFQFRVIPSLTVTTAYVILCGDERFEITSVEDVKGRGMYIEVLVKKVTADG